MGDRFLALAVALTLVRAGVRGVQHSIVAGLQPPGGLEGCHCSRQVRRLFRWYLRQILLRACCFQEPPPAKLFCFSPTSHLSFSVCKSGSSHQPCPRQAGCQSCLRMRLTCSQLPLGSAPRQVLLSFPWRARLDFCKGQGQLGAGPQPEKVPWSGLVPSSSHQPWGRSVCRGLCAVPRCLLSCVFLESL